MSEARYTVEYDNSPACDQPYALQVHEGDRGGRVLGDFYREVDAKMIADRLNVYDSLQARLTAAEKNLEATRCLLDEKYPDFTGVLEETQVLRTRVQQAEAREATLQEALMEGIGVIDTLYRHDSADPEKWESRIRMLGIWKDQAQQALGDGQA